MNFTITNTKDYQNMVEKYISTKCLKSRLKIELEKILEKYPKIILNLERVLKYDISFLDIVTVIVFEKDHDDAYKYKFMLEPSYPFSRPEIYCNDIMYSDFLKISSNRMLKHLKNIYNKDCLCCDSYICTENWNLTTKLINIIHEINYNRQLKKNIIIKILCDKIVDKYLISDICLDKYLFSSDHLLV